MTDLDTLLNENRAPTVRGDLSSRILMAAETAEPANDTASRRPWYAISGVAAMAVMAAFFVMQPLSEPATDWEQIADGSGFSDLYEWVEGEEG